MTAPSLDSNSLPDALLAKEGGETKKISLIGLNRQIMAQKLREIGLSEREARLRVRQLWHWIYVRGANDFSQIQNFSKNLLSQLDAHFTIKGPELVREQISQDGTYKWLLRFAKDDKGRQVEVETVYIPEADRGTLCLSSQVGCSLNCSFCHTGTQAFVRNLSPAEIIGQVLYARRRLGDFPLAMKLKSELPAAKADGPAQRAGECNRKITNIVMMGMGEPLYNYDNVKESLLIIADNEGLSLSRRRITLSTAGVVPKIGPIGAETGVMLAISLHAVDNELRNKLVPLNKKYPIEALLAACKNYPSLSNARRITFEYVMLDNINDSLNDAIKLVRLLRDIPAKINLIPFNPWPGSHYRCSSEERINDFARYLNDAGYSSPVRKPRGQDILAACGQLKSQTERLWRYGLAVER